MISLEILNQKAAFYKFRVCALVCVRCVCIVQGEEEEEKEEIMRCACVGPGEEGRMEKKRKEVGLCQKASAEVLLAAVEGWLSVLNSVCLFDLQAENVTCTVEDAEGETGGLFGMVVFVMFTERGCSVVVSCRSEVFTICRLTNV